VPTFRPLKVKLPAPLLIVLLTKPVCCWVSETSAPGITAPALSSTVPVMVEFCCALPVRLTRSRKRGSRNILHLANEVNCTFMRHSPMNWLHITSEVRISAKLQKLCRGVYPAFGCAQDSLSSAVLGRYLPSVRFDT